MTNQRSTETPSTYLVAVALGTVYVVWGSTYLAIRFAIETLPPFLMAGIRFTIAGAVLFTILRLHSRSTPITLSQWRSAAIVGTLLLLGGNGLVCWSEQTVPSGLAALMVATVPLWMVTLDWLWHGAIRPTWRIIAGLAAGMLGVLILMGPGDVLGGGIDPWGGGALLAACVFWSIGSLHSRRADLPRSPFLATAMEMICGGAALFIIATLQGEWSRVDMSAVSLKSLLALAYLIVFGAIISLSAYVWLLQVAPPARVATYAYVNPVIAVFLGALFAGEALSARTILAAVIIIVAVIIITLESARVKARQKANAPAGAPNPALPIMPTPGLRNPMPTANWAATAPNPNLSTNAENDTGPAPLARCDSGCS